MSIVFNRFLVYFWTVGTRELWVVIQGVKFAFDLSRTQAGKGQVGIKGGAGRMGPAVGIMTRIGHASRESAHTVHKTEAESRAQSRQYWMHSVINRGDREKYVQSPVAHTPRAAPFQIVLMFDDRVIYWFATSARTLQRARSERTAKLNNFRTKF